MSHVEGFPMGRSAICSVLSQSREQTVPAFGTNHKAHKGERLITPEMLEDVQDSCGHHRWNGPIVYDS